MATVNSIEMSEKSDADDERSSSTSNSGSTHSPSKAYRTHDFKRKVTLSRAFCQHCNLKVSSSLQECSKCKLSGHKACLQETFIKCGPSYYMMNPFYTPMFGTYLTEHIDDLPVIIKQCVQELEIRSPRSIQFVYMAKGNEEEIGKLVKAFDFAPKLVDLSAVAYYDIGQLLKRFFVELKYPVVSCKPRLMMLEVIKMLPDDGLGNLLHDDTDKIRRIVRRKLVRAHRITLAFFLHHLRNLADKHDQTEIGISDLANIFGPILCGHGENANACDPHVIEDKKLLKTLMLNVGRFFEKPTH